MNEIGKFILVSDLYCTDFMKDKNGKIKLYDTIEEARTVCGMYEFDCFILEVKHYHKEPGNINW